MAFKDTTRSSRPWLVIDFETVSFADLPKVGSYRYAVDPTTEVLCFAYETRAGRRALWKPGDPCPFPPEVLSTYTFIAHNCSFERAIWTAHMVGELGWPEVPISQWHDTQARAQQLALPGQLEKVLRVLKAPIQKNTEGSKLVKALNRVNKKTGKLPERTPEILQQVYDYCLDDIDGEVWLHKRLGWLPLHERPIWELSQAMNDLGIGIDMEFVKAAQRIVDDASGPLVEEFQKLTDGLKPSQRDKFLAWLDGRGVHLANLTKETLEKLLGKDDQGDADDDAEAEVEDIGDPEADPEHELIHVDLPKDAERALRIRQLVNSASIKKLAAMEKAVGFDGFARGLMVYHGTMPGRQTAKIVQPHNFPRGTVQLGESAPDPETLVQLIKQGDYELLEMVYGTGAVEIIASSLRHALVAGDDYEFVAGDYAGIQARSVLALAGQTDKCELLASGADVYIDMGCDIHGLPKPSWTDKEAISAFKKKYPRERQDGKNSVLGLGFQMGPPKFHDKYCPDQPFEFATNVVRTYRKIWAPCVPDLWYALQDAATDTVWSGVPHEAYGVTYSLEDIWLKATIHNGSSIYYTYPQRATKPAPWDPEKQLHAFTYQTYKQGQWVTRTAFGGQLTENVIMKIEREIMESAKRRLAAAGYAIPFEVHDEAVTRRRKAEVDRAAFRQIMENVDPWVRQLGIPIAVEEWVGERYRK